MNPTRKQTNPQNNSFEIWANDLNIYQRRTHSQKIYEALAAVSSSLLMQPAMAQVVPAIHLQLSSWLKASA